MFIPPVIRYPCKSSEINWVLDFRLLKTKEKSTLDIYQNKFKKFMYKLLLLLFLFILFLISI